ncbi:hypothetical protein AURDEDRAFT_114691 [Auricularia subglabra TFB-10046 SS5]|nr:hypothetical protein AURDEDRAFT_114691 [Auricularia subglabra TFB-10046 SS5]
MARSFCIPGIIILALALACGILASISLPFLPALEVARTTFRGSSLPSGAGDAIRELRLGIWSYCTYSLGSGDRTCSTRGHAYSFLIKAGSNQVAIQSSWTRGLAITPVATAVTFVAFLLSFSEHLTLTLVSSLVSFLAALLMFIAFICDIALYAWLRAKLDDLDGIEPHTNTGAGFWLTFAAFILLLLGGCTVCFGRRRDKRLGANSYPLKTGGFFSRFRR